MYAGAHTRVREFLSTLSLRRATASNQQEQQQQHDFYPRSPCGERLRLYRLSLIMLPISIHALLAESDCKRDVLCRPDRGFLSTLSLRRATLGRVEAV